MCGTRGASGRRTLPVAIRTDGSDAVIRRGDPDPRASPRRSREGQRDRDDLYFRRSHRCGLVARALAAHADRHRPGWALPARTAFGSAWLAVSRARWTHGQPGATPDHRVADRVR